MADTLRPMSENEANLLVELELPGSIVGIRRLFSDLYQVEFADGRTQRLKLARVPNWTTARPTRDELAAAGLVLPS